MLRDNLKTINEKIDGRACLIAVSKFNSAEKINEAIDLGVTDIGENKVQEIVVKTPQLPGDIRWHMIGHLQRNKVRQLVGRVDRIHSVDSLRLAKQIQSDFEKQAPINENLCYANVDTTFALHSNTRSYSLRFSMRTLGNMRLRHLPRYFDYDKLSADEKYYIEHADKSSSVASKVKNL